MVTRQVSNAGLWKVQLPSLKSSLSPLCSNRQYHPIKTCIENSHESWELKEGILFECFLKVVNHLRKCNSNTAKVYSGTALTVPWTCFLPCRINQVGVRSFGMILIRINDPGSLGSCCIRGIDDSTLGADSSLSLMHRDPSDLGSWILI